MAAETHELMGRRVKLLYADDEYARLMPGDLGTVVDVDNAGQLLVESDSGSRLSLIPDRDRWLELPPGRTFEDDAWKMPPPAQRGRADLLANRRHPPRHPARRRDYRRDPRRNSAGCWRSAIDQARRVLEETVGAVTPTTMRSTS